MVSSSNKGFSRLLLLACIALFSALALVQAEPIATPVPELLQQRSLAAGQLDAQNRIPRREDLSPLAEDAAHENLKAFAPAQEQEDPKPTPAFIHGRDDIPDRPLSELGPPTFPAQYPSCQKCQAQYSSISSCMEASSVFANTTSIFNDPISYIAVIKCACTDTFQAVYPQCVDCFQHTDQCWYLGTDPQGTGAGQLTTNIRQICGFGSALLGGVAASNGLNNSGVNVSVVPTYTDVSTT